MTVIEWVDEDGELVEREPCEHRHVSDEAGYPDPSGRCRVYAVCEDCGENLGQSGWDSI